MDEGITNKTLINFFIFTHPAERWEKGLLF